MRCPGISRRDLLKGSAALAAGAAFSTRVMAAAPPAEPVTPALIEAAKKEGQVIYYTSTDLPVAEKLAKAFEANIRGSPCGSSAPARNGCSSASVRNIPATSTPSIS
jgi:hypothetical protein